MNQERIETIEDMISELECLKKYHNFHLRPVSTDFLRWMAETLQEVGIEPDDILASIDQPPEVQEQYLLFKSAPGHGMGHGALGDLKILLQREKRYH